jgi:hypothetical protein
MKANESEEKMQKKIRAGIFVLIIAAVSVSAARADATLTFTPSTLSTTPGGTVEFDGTLTNTGTFDLYLNGDSFDLEYSDLTVDDSPFIFSGPMLLSAGESFSGAFIDVTADAATPSGSYSGTYTIQGGTDANTFDDIAMEDFTIDIGAMTPISEPNPFLLLATGLAIIALVRSARRPSATLNKSI